MTTLEKEMLDAIQSAERYDEHQEAINCAEIARKWIKKAVDESSETYMEGFIKDWFKQNDSLL